MKKLFLHLTLVAALFLNAMQSCAAEAFEIGRQNRDQLPKGKEADGIPGDFVLRNDLVEALVSGNLPLRKANMSTFGGADGITPGCLYDLTFRGKPNDQITVFAPLDQRGQVSYVRIAKTNAAIETVLTAPRNDGLSKRHDYVLEDGWQGLLIVTTLRNESKEIRKHIINDRWTTFLTNGVFQGFRWADAVDPSDRAGYSYRCTNCPPGGQLVTNLIEIAAGQEIVVSRFLALGNSPAEAVGVAASREGPVGRLTGSFTDESGLPVSSTTVRIQSGDQSVNAYAGVDGRFSFPFPAGSYQVTIADRGRASLPQQIEVRAGETTALSHQFSPRFSISFEITDDRGRDIPCKAQFIGIGNTASPDLGPPNRAHGCKDQYHSETGKFVTAVPPGRYRIVVTHGIEFSHLSCQIELGPGENLKIQGQLTRMVDTRGWVSADYHNHSTPSGDNTCGTDDRIINLAAEQIEFAPTTEHNRLYDWRPHIERLGLTREINTVSGLELTGSGPHFNSFPFKPDPSLQDSGAPVWNRDPRITAILLRNHQEPNPDRWIQINHPDLVENFIDRDGDGLADGGYVGLGSLIDAVEVQNFIDSTLLSPFPVRIYKDRTNRDSETAIYNREFVWLQLLNRGHQLVAMAVADAHSVHGNGVGGWRMYMPSKSDEPAEIDWRENSRHAKAGRSILTTGPFLQLQTSDGILPGGLARGSGGLTLQVKIQCTDWIDIDRVQVLVNGRQKPELNFTRQSHPDMFKNGVVKFDREIRVPLSEDAHLVVVACHESMNLSLGYGTSDQASLRPFAFNNPIYVDVDGGGFKANGDTLDFPLVTRKPTLEEARKILSKSK